MIKLNVSKIYIQVMLLLALIVIVVGSSSYLFFNVSQEELLSQPINKYSNRPLNKYSADIAIGKPCDARELESYRGGGKIVDTKGLQCYMYDDLSALAIKDGVWNHPGGKETIRRGIWIYPNHISDPIFLTDMSPSLFDYSSLNDFTKNWKLYNNPKFNYSFKFPSKWQTYSDPSEPNQLIVREVTSADSTLEVTINYYPAIKFEDTVDFKNIKDAPDDWFIPDSSTNTFIRTRHFDLNGAKALLVQRMSNYDLGGNKTYVTIYVSKPSSYFIVSYVKYNDVNLDLPVEALIKTLRF